MHRFYWRDQIHQLDAEKDALRIRQILTAHEFPWDMTRALGLALFRTYAVPSIGELLHRTAAFTGEPQKRYDDTALVLGTMLRYGFEGKGREALRRMNQMHRSYDISNDDYRYVLSSFVVMPVRWINDQGFGWRRLTGHEISATVHYYRQLGRRMGIKDIPETYAEFERLLEDYEREHVAHTKGGRAVADATLELMISFYPPRIHAGVRKFTIAQLDDHLRQAFGYERPSVFWRVGAQAAMRTRARIVRFMKPREEPHWVENNPNLRSYPDGFEVSKLGTFPDGCPAVGAESAGAGSEAGAAAGSETGAAKDTSE